MKIKAKFIIVTVVLGALALAFGHTFWPPAAGLPVPTPTQIGFFEFFGIIEALFFGFGVAFIIFGYPLVRRVAQELKRPALAGFVALAWLLVSWWPHDNLHMHNGMDIQ